MCLRRQIHRSLCVILFLGFAASISRVDAEQVVFTLDESQSSLTMSGFFGEFALVPQDEDETSFTTSYSGTLTVDVDDPMAPTLIEFLSGDMVAGISGDWLPEVGGGIEGDPESDPPIAADPGMAQPANYGMFSDLNGFGSAWGTFRGLSYTAVSFDGDMESINDDGDFDSNYSVITASGTLDSNISSILGNDAGTDDDISGEEALNDAGPGNYSVNGSIATLTLPMELLYPGDLEIFMEGQIVATAMVGSGLLGDYNQNGELDAGDLDLQAEAISGGQNPSAFDLNDDGLVDFDDRRIWVEELKNTYLGDWNLDLEFESGDLVGVFGLGKYESGNPATWAQGDSNGDMLFASGDLVTAFGEGGYEEGPRGAVSAVPEPSTLVLGLLAFGSALLAGRRQRA